MKSDNPETILDEIKLSRKFLKEDFWEKDYHELSIHKELIPVLEELNVLFNYYNLIHNEIEKVDDFFKQQNCNISRNSLLVNFFKYLEFKEIDESVEFLDKSKNYPVKSDLLTFKALYSILNENILNLSENNDVSIIPNDYLRKIDYRIEFEKDKLKLNEFIDAYLCGNFVIEINNGNYELVSIDNKTKSLKLKDFIKSIYNQHFVSNKLSDDEYFKNADKAFKSHEGFPGFIVLQGKVSDTGNDNVVALDAKDIYPDINQLSEEEMHKKTSEIHAKALFNYNFRRNMQESYLPTDEVDIKETYYEFGENKISIYNIFKGLNYLTAYSITYNLLCVSLHMINKIRNWSEEIKKEEQFNKSNSLQMIFDYLNEIGDLQELENYMCVFRKEDLLELLAKKNNLSSDEINHILDFFTFGKSNFDITPLVYSENSYYWSSLPFLNNSLSVYFYNYFFLEKNFSVKQFRGTNEKDKAKNRKISENAKNRSDLFNTHLSKLFEMNDFITAIGNETDKQYEIDLLAFNEIENILFCIEVKINNKPCDTYYDKKTLNESILKAKDQLKKRLHYLNTPNSDNFIYKKLKKRKNSETKIYPFIVIDNFYFEGDSVQIDENLKAYIISFFSLSLILKNKLVFPEFTEYWYKLQLLNRKNTLPDNMLHLIENYHTLVKEERFALKKFFEELPKDNPTSKSIIEQIENNILWQNVEKVLNINSSNLEKSLVTSRPLFTLKY